ncbi:hypothetical protein PIB30_011236 [Stylosanthes scabra]|uniref:Uncharacterized protein n=1 Tax=Stylosanthes scabra TaxID=79078 RepID=A0ABU6T5H6_9FABA|nr:hypothetical protein [Stylosanthes scabra]
MRVNNATLNLNPYLDAKLNVFTRSTVAPSSIQARSSYIRRGQRELRVVVNRASIGTLDQKLSRPEVDARGVRIDWNQFFNQFWLTSLSFLVEDEEGK